MLLTNDTLGSTVDCHKHPERQQLQQRTISMTSLRAQRSLTTVSHVYVARQPHDQLEIAAA